MKYEANWYYYKYAIINYLEHDEDVTEPDLITFGKDK